MIKTALIFSVVLVITSTAIALFYGFKFKDLERRYHTQFEELIFQAEDDYRSIQRLVRLYDTCNLNCDKLKEGLDQELLGTMYLSGDLWEEYVPESFDTMDTSDSPMYRR